MMRVKLFYCAGIKNGSVQLCGPQAHQLINVLRLHRKDVCELFDGRGTLADAVIKQIDHRQATLEVRNVKKISRPFTQNIIIASDIAKGKRFDWLIEKCTELGIDRIIPVLFDRTIRIVKNPKTCEHWLNVSIAAAKQSGRIYLPKIDAPLPLFQAMEVLHKSRPRIKILFGNVTGEAAVISEYLPSDTDVAAFIGPQGGLTDNELELLEKNGASACRISNNILRTETAAVAFGSILSANRFIRCGDK